MQSEVNSNIDLSKNKNYADLALCKEDYDKIKNGIVSYFTTYETKYIDNEIVVIRELRSNNSLQVRIKDISVYIHCHNLHIISVEKI